MKRMLLVIVMIATGLAACQSPPDPTAAPLTPQDDDQRKQDREDEETVMSPTDDVEEPINDDATPLPDIDLTPRPRATASRGDQGGGIGTGHLYIEAASVEGRVVTFNGSLADSCTTLGEISEAVEDDTIRLTVLADRPPNLMCAAVLQPFTATYTLTSDLEAGRYTLIINDEVSVEFTIE